MLPVTLEVTHPHDAQAAVEAALARFERIDVLVLVPLAALEDPLIRFAAAADAVQTFEANANALLVQAHLHRELSGSLAYDTP